MVPEDKPTKICFPDGSKRATVIAELDSLQYKLKVRGRSVVTVVGSIGWVLLLPPCPPPVHTTQRATYALF